MKALTVIPKHDHNYYSSSKAINLAAWDFLKTYRLIP